MCVYKGLREPRLGSLAPWSTPVGLWGTARPVPACPAPSQRRPGLPGWPTGAAPRRALDGGATAAAARPPCALRAAANALCAPLLCCRTRQCGRRPPARAHSELQLSQRPSWPLRWPPRQRRGAALRRPCGGLTTCETRQARPHMSGEVSRQSWGRVQRVRVVFVRVSGRLYACICMA